MIITQHVPMCPKCSALLNRREQGGSHYFYCVDCKSIYKVIGVGEAEIELIVTDRSKYETPSS